MYESRALDAFERVRTECVALRLREVLRQASGPITVEIREAARQRWHGYAGMGGSGDDTAPARDRPADLVCDPFVHQEVHEIRLRGERGTDGVEQFRADDAAPLPDTGHLGEIDV